MLGGRSERSEGRDEAPRPAHALRYRSGRGTHESRNRKRQALGFGWHALNAVKGVIKRHFPFTPFAGAQGVPPAACGKRWVGHDCLTHACRSSCVGAGPSGRDGSRVSAAAWLPSAVPVASSSRPPIHARGVSPAGRIVLFTRLTCSRSTRPGRRLHVNAPLLRRPADSVSTRAIRPPHRPGPGRRSRVTVPLRRRILTRLRHRPPFRQALFCLLALPILL